MIRLLQSSWMTALIGCLLYLAVTAALIRPSEFAGVHRRNARQSIEPGDEPSWEFRNPEFDQWVAEIKHERAALALRKKQLDDLQTRLETERKELNAVTQQVYQVQETFDKNVVRLKEQQVTNLQRQAKLLASMSPSGAAGLLTQMPEDDAVRILYTMKTDAASSVLEAMSKTGSSGAKLAAALTERMSLALPPPGSSRTKTPF